MVNERIYDYLKQYKDKFPFEALKQKCIDSGYSKKDVEEAAMFLEPNSKKQKTNKKNSENLKSSKQETKNNNENLANKKPKGYSKFMKISGTSIILSILFSILLVIIPILILIQGFSGGSIDSFVYLFVIIIFLLFVFSFFIFLGLYLIGKRYKNTLLKITVGLGFIFALAILIFLAFSMFSNSLFSFSPEQFLSPTSLQGQEQQALQDVSPGIMVLGIVLAILSFIFHILFCIGLMKLPEKVKHAKTIGILFLVGFFTSPLFGIGGVLVFVAEILMIPMFFNEAKK